MGEPRAPPEGRFDRTAPVSTFTKVSEAKRPDVAGVPISSADRLLYPALSLTKLELARFYERIAEWILPHLRDRPLTLVHCPVGVGSPCRFMKHSKVWAPAPVRRVRIHEKTKLGEYLIVDDVAGLIGLIQMDVLELHTWNSRFGAVDQPDRIVIDLDPGPEVPFREVISAARLVRSALSALKLESFVKTTGGVGLHVVVPIEPELGWDETLAFARRFSEVIVRHDPSRYTTRFIKRGRENKILIDYLRNNRTNTSVAAYSTRARPTAPLSVPLAWDELSPRLTPQRFTVTTLERRLRRLGADPWRRYGRVRQRLSSELVQALGASGSDIR